MADIMLGQYYPENSIIHRLDPRVKLFGTLIFIVALFCTNNFLGFIFIIAFLVGIMKSSKVPIGKMLKGLKGIMVILFLTVILNILFTPGVPLFSVGILTITREGIVSGIFLAWRLTLLGVSTSVLTFTTTPNDLADGLEKGFGWLNKIHFPVHEMAMMMSLALRFIPTLIEETEKIKKAQRARGADFESGGMIKRINSLIPLLVPLFVSSIRRALDLAMAMEARCYRGGNRTKLKPLQYRKRDAIAYLSFLIFMLIIIGTRFATSHIEILGFFVVD